MFKKRKYKHKYRLHEWADLLESNWKSGVFNDVEYGYTSPSPDTNRVPSWLWDSCFHAYMRVRENPERAKAEMRTLLKFLYPNGLPPMILYLRLESFRRRVFERVFWKRYLQINSPGTILTQPPIHAETVWEIYQRTGDVEFLKETAPDLKRIYRYFRDHRDVDGNGLAAVIHPLETGMDSSPDFDESVYGRRGSLPLARFVINYLLYRHYHKLNWQMDKILKVFNFESPMFNALYALNLEALAKILETIDDPDTAEFKELAARVKNALIRHSYNEETGLFHGLYKHKQGQSKAVTVSSIMPIVLDLPPEIAIRLVDHILDPLMFATDYPLPSVARKERAFYPGSTKYLWRGTKWININWYIVRGLLRHGFNDLAAEISRKTADAVLQYGFREYYNPLTGEGYGDTEHGWSTLIIDMLERTGLLEEYLEKSKYTPPMSS